MANEAEGTENDGRASTSKSKGPVRFFGTYPAKVALGTSQVTLPKMIKKAMEDGDEGQLMLVPRDGEPYWQLFTQKVYNQKIEDTKVNPNFKDKNLGKVMALKMTKTAIPVECDPQGRFQVKGFATKLNSDSNDVIFEAAHTHVRLWTLKDYNAEQERLAALEQSDEMKQAMREVLDD